MTVTSARRSANHWPGLDVLPDRPPGPLLRPGRPDPVRRRRSTGSTSPSTSVTRRSAVAVRSWSCSRPEEFFLRLGRDQLIGFGEAYLTGAWDAEDLGGFLTVLAARMQHLIPEPLQKLRALVVRKPPEEELSSTENSRDNIAHHYDLSNELFELFLDPTLSYSSALFPPDQLDGVGHGAGPRDRPGPQDRAAARPGRRHRGLPGARDRLGLGRARDPRRPAGRDRPHDHALDRAEGAGRRADRRGRAVTDRVTVELCDYRDVVR